MQNRNKIALLLVYLLVGTSTPSSAKDFFLTIGGGNAPSSNQASLEKNVLFFQRLLKEQDLRHLPNDIYFADGQASGSDLQVKNVDSIPKANRLMAEFFGTQRNLGLSYRNHEVPGVRGATTAGNIRRWFKDVGPTMTTGDRLILYVTAHGKGSENREKPYDTSFSLWNNQKLSVSELVGMLDQLPGGVSVVAIMVQCHAGGFARFLYNAGDPDQGFSKQRRCGFFATLHDRLAAGCTPEINEATYVEYSTYFWEALAGHTRTGETIVAPDYDGDGIVSFDEAHAYTVLKANTIDMPIKTSGEFLGVESLFKNDRHPELLTMNASYASVLEHATPTERAILQGLSQQLDLMGDRRIETARRRGQPSGRNSRGSTRGRPTERTGTQLRQKIATDLKRRWPALANVLNPGAVELMTTRSDEFIKTIEEHSSYRRYRDQLGTAATRPNAEKRQAKYLRFVRTAEIVILRENLERLGDKQTLARYQAIAAAERNALHPADSTTDVAPASRTNTLVRP